jgi:hypothetical protein
MSNETESGGNAGAELSIGRVGTSVKDGVTST